MLFAILAFNAFLTSCSDEEPFSTATPNDEPRILDPTFPDRVNGNLATFANFSRDGKFSMKLTVTPADYTTVTWFVDGEEVATGTEIEKEFMAGTYHLKITATTTVGKSTYREGLIQVNPLADDPSATEVAFERIVAPVIKLVFTAITWIKWKAFLLVGWLPRILLMWSRKMAIMWNILCLPACRREITGLFLSMPKEMNMAPIK